MERFNQTGQTLNSAGYVWLLACFLVMMGCSGGKKTPRVIAIGGSVTYTSVSTTGEFILSIDKR